MLAAPAQWLIQLIALLPVLLRPGVFLAIIISLLWFVFRRRGLPSLWKRLCRGVAITLDATVGLALFPEYLVTTSRRRKGAAPGSITRTLGPVAEFALDRAAALYRNNLSEEPTPPAQPSTKTPSSTTTPTKGPARKRFPWVWCGLVIAVFAGLWTIMDQLPRTDPAKRTFAEGFEYWRDVEAWGQVDSTRRATPGDQIPPKVTGISYHRRYAHIALACPYGIPCDGEVTVRTTTGAIVASKTVTINAETSQVITVSLPRLPPRTLRRLHADIAAYAP